MNIAALFENIPTISRVHWNSSCDVKRITSDSRMIERGDLFVACCGVRMNGHDFIGQAIQSGVSVVVYDEDVEFKIPEQVIVIRVENSRKCLSQLLKRYYQIPDDAIRLVGVTGTNGKTTITSLLYSLLNNDERCGLIGTLGYDWGREHLSAANTTPPPEFLYSYLCDMIKQGIKYCFMEVSSHSIDQARIAGLEYELGIFTQLTQDHLDYHKTMERYYQTKRCFFVNKPKPRHVLINSDCHYGKRLLEEILEAKGFGLSSDRTQYRANHIECSFQGSRFIFEYGKERLPIKIQMPFRYNVSNTLAVLSGLDLLGFNPKKYVKTLEAFKGVPGRLERFQSESGAMIFVDYAHTPDAVEKVLSEARKLNPKRIFSLMGCGGDRDTAKRPQMAKAATRYSDFVMLTSDNPRSEDPATIIHDMKKGISPDVLLSQQVETIVDRYEAIQKIVSKAEHGDVVFILGKGHEDYQILGDSRIPFDDRLVVQECLKGKNRVFFS